MTNGADNAATDGKMSTDEVDIPVTDVSIYEALYRRRMSWHFKDELIQRAVMERMLEAAVWAPNHRLTEPWRFFVLEKGSEGRRKVADLAYQFSLQQSNNPTRAESAQREVLEPPVVIYVYCVPGPNEEVTRENYAAVCCAAHNMSLVGVAEGLAVTWETGGPTRDPNLREALGAEEDWMLAVMLSIGVPAEPSKSLRTPVARFVRWFG